MELLLDDKLAPPDVRDDQQGCCLLAPFPLLLTPGFDSKLTIQEGILEQPRPYLVLLDLLVLPVPVVLEARVEADWVDRPPVLLLPQIRLMTLL